MNPTPRPHRPALQADPRIVNKVRRDNAASAYYGALLGEETHDYLLHPSLPKQANQPLDFGRPGW